MSTILDALRRIEAQEEGRRDAPLASRGPEALVALGVPNKSPTRRILGILFAMTLAIALGAAGTLTLLEVVEEPVLGSAAPASSALGAASPAIPVQIDAELVVTKEETEAVASEVALRSQAVERIAALPTPEIAMELALVERDFSSRPEPSALPVPVVEENIPEIRELEDAYVVERARIEPPVVVRPPVPAISIKRTVWHPRRERREAVVEILEGDETRIVKLHEGEFLGPLMVQEIRPTGVVTFLHDGIELQRRVGQP